MAVYDDMRGGWVWLKGQERRTETLEVERVVAAMETTEPVRHEAARWQWAGVAHHSFCCGVGSVVRESNSKEVNDRRSLSSHRSQR
jgi:hypothetical protein